jgi:hypothetical protein
VTKKIVMWLATHAGLMRFAWFRRVGTWLVQKTGADK